MRCDQKNYIKRSEEKLNWEFVESLVGQMMFNLVYPLMPSLLEDIKERFE